MNKRRLGLYGAAGCSDTFSSQIEHFEALLDWKSSNYFYLLRITCCVLHAPLRENSSNEVDLTGSLIFSAFCRYYLTKYLECSNGEIELKGLKINQVNNRFEIFHHDAPNCSSAPFFAFFRIDVEFK